MGPERPKETLPAQCVLAIDNASLWRAQYNDGPGGRTTRDTPSREGLWERGIFEISPAVSATSALGRGLTQIKLRIRCSPWYGVATF